MMNTNNYSHKRTQRPIANNFLLAAMIFGASALGYSQENTLPDSGNVGIGTTDPSAKLQVSGSAIIDSSLTVNDSLNANAVSTGRLSVADDAKVEDDLKVGGNLILPSLTFAETYPETLTFLFADDEAIVRKGSFSDAIDVLKSLMYATPPNLATCTSAYSNNPTWRNGVNKIYENCPDVKVGIGTDVPEFNLDVRGNSKFGAHAWFSSTLSVGADNNSFARLYVNNPSSSAGLQITNGSSAGTYSKLVYLTFTEPTTEIFNVKNTAQNFTPFLLTGKGEMTLANSLGNIFKLEESGKLTLYSNGQQTFRVETNGLIRARRAKIDLDTWADYVFEPTYRLRPLSEVESYVVAEKHLPGIPSEQELIEEGMDVTEMNRLLMEKVEELTLYLIEQNKKDAQLQAEIEALKATVAELHKNK